LALPIERTIAELEHCSFTLPAGLAELDIKRGSHW
jgi:hypothetical protein